MQSQEDKLRLFTQAINSYAEEQRLRILYDIDRWSTAELDKAEKEALADAYKHIQKETAQVRASVVRELSAKELESRRSLFNARMEIENKVFQSAAERLRSFAESAEYKDYIKRATDAVVRTLTHASQQRTVDKAVLAATQIRLRPQDMALKEYFSQSIHGCSVVADSSIALGGFAATNDELGVCVDMTLDSRLEQQREAFRETSGLTIS